MRRALVILAGGLLLLGSLGFATGAMAANTAAATTTCANGMDNAGGQGLICEVTIVNVITASGGSARVTIRECHGGAGVPTAACTTTRTILTRPVTAVNQCNGSINGGGGTLRCSVRITNRFVGVRPGSSTATINQCVGSGDGETSGCDPFPATTTGAAITQCNGSANGGTLVGLTCTASGSAASARRVPVNQCNGSGNGGGGLVICWTEIRNVVVATGSGGGGGGGPTIPPTDTATPTADPAASPAPFLVVVVFLFAFVVTGRRSMRSIRRR